MSSFDNILHFIVFTIGHVAADTYAVREDHKNPSPNIKKDAKRHFKVILTMILCPYDHYLFRYADFTSRLIFLRRRQLNPP